MAANLEHPISRFSVGIRVSLLLAGALVLCAAIFFVVEQTQHSQVDLLLRERAAETSRVLLRILDLRASGARIHADDYTRWDEFVAFTRKPDPKWAQVNLTENIATFGLDAAWVLDAEYQLIVAVNPEGNAALASLPVPLPELASALQTNPIRHFYARSSGGTLEIWTSSIQPSADLHRREPPSGYYLVGRLWTKARMSELSRVAGGGANLEPIGTEPPRSIVGASTGSIRIVLPLPDIHGRPSALLAYDTTYPVAPRVHEALTLSLILLLGTCVVSFLTVAVVLSHWVARPLSLVIESLREEDPSLLDRTIRRRDEFGQLARLVGEFFAQQEHLLAARRAAEDAAEGKQRFVTSISHELRTPMHGVLSFARFGAQEAVTADRAELVDYFRQIDTSGSRLIALLDELLDLAKLDAGKMTLEFAPCPLAEVAREAAAEFTGVCLERKLSLELRIDPQSPIVKLDSSRIRQVLRNLLSNAAKFSPSGETISLTVERIGRVARVVVEDSGAGIPPGELQLIFATFSQATTNRRGSGGSGLGLALCREIVEAHGGRIWAENRAPRGARMLFELPLDGPVEAAPTSKETSMPRDAGEAAA